MITEREFAGFIFLPKKILAVPLERVVLSFFFVLSGLSGPLYTSRETNRFPRSRVKETERRDSPNLVHFFLFDVF